MTNLNLCGRTLVCGSTENTPIPKPTNLYFGKISHLLSLGDKICVLCSSICSRVVVVVLVQCVTRYVFMVLCIFQYRRGI